MIGDVFARAMRIPKTIHTYLNNQTTYIISVSVSFYYRFVTVSPTKNTINEQLTKTLNELESERKRLYEEYK